MKRCILEDRICTWCGDCEVCDLDKTKKCNNCGKCIDSDAEYRVIQVEDVLLGLDKPNT